ncbi:MAG: hypothetical protein WB676_27805, partial [Bryobacteraceae bacterium]
ARFEQPDIFVTSSEERFDTTSDLNTSFHLEIWGFGCKRGDGRRTRWQAPYRGAGTATPFRGERNYHVHLTVL